MSAADETAAQIVSVSFRSGKQLTSQTLIKVLQKVIEIEKAARAADKENMTADPTGGKVPYKKLMKQKQPLVYALDKEGNPIDIPRADMDLFNRAAKKYGLKYSLVKEVFSSEAYSEESTEASTEVAITENSSEASEESSEATTEAATEASTDSSSDAPLTTATDEYGLPDQSAYWEGDGFKLSQYILDCGANNVRAFFTFYPLFDAEYSIYRSYDH